VAKKIFFASFVNSGQVCMAIKRIYAHESIYEQLCAALVEEAKKAKVGDGLDPATELGPVQNKMQYDKVVGIIKDTKKAGATFLTGGEIPSGPGYFLPPTLVTDIADDSRLVQEEQFGPIVPILKFSDVDDALRRANDTRYGLSGSVWTKDLNRGAEIAARLKCAWVNAARRQRSFRSAARKNPASAGSIPLGLKSLEPEVVSVAKR
jgi:acyl-CoA reductase-like NAD-dependent aldehyde dehydrogenase